MFNRIMKIIRTITYKSVLTFGLLVVFLLCPAMATAQQESADIRSGNKFYKQEKYTEAEVEYRKGLDKNKNSFEGRFNLGDALYRQEKYDDAIEQFKSAGTLAGDDKDKLASVNHNIGNALLQQQKYAESITAYKQALKNNPKDDETRYNLAYAQEMLRQQQQQQQQNQDNKNDKEDNKNEQQQQNQQEQQKEQEQQEQQSQSQEQTMSKENAEQILDALLQDEKETQEKAKRATMKGAKKADKDW